MKLLKIIILALTNQCLMAGYPIYDDEFSLLESVIQVPKLQVVGLDSRWEHRADEIDNPAHIHLQVYGDEIDGMYTLYIAQGSDLTTRQKVIIQNGRLENLDGSDIVVKLSNFLSADLAGAYLLGIDSYKFGLLSLSPFSVVITPATDYTLESEGSSCKDADIDIVGGGFQAGECLAIALYFSCEHSTWLNTRTLHANDHGSFRYPVETRSHPGEFDRVVVFGSKGIVDCAIKP